MSRAIELVDCQDPRQVVRSAAATYRELAALTEALAPRTVETPDGQVTVAPTTAQLEGARVHVIPLPQEMRADGTITPPAAVVIVDGPEADQVAALVDAALFKRATVKPDSLELPEGTKVVLDGPPLADVGAVPRLPKAARLTKLAADVVELDIKHGIKEENKIAVEEI